MFRADLHMHTILSDGTLLPVVGSVTVSVDVTNTGERAGDEVVQLYVTHMGSAVDRPRLDLRGYRRIALDPGEARTVEFPLDGMPRLQGWLERIETRNSTMRARALVKPYLDAVLGP